MNTFMDVLKDEAMDNKVVPIDKEEVTPLICEDCVKPPRLKRLIAEGGHEGACHYCGVAARAIPRKVLFDFIAERVNENVAAEEDLSSYEHGMIYEVGDNSIPVADIAVALIEWFELDEEPYLDDLLDQVPNEFRKNAHGDETHFYRDDGELERNLYESRWQAFIDNIRHSHRFFNPQAKEFLNSVFSFLLADNSALKPECVRVLKRGDALFRARTVRTYEDAKRISANPASELGPTPRDKASSQRMTPTGISAMYCALDRETCFSEIRAITGDLIVSGAMTPIGQLRLLDLTKLTEAKAPALTLLDEGYLEALHLERFVGSLVKKMSIPKARNDELTYLSTQVVFEYLRLRFGPEVDGLVFPSVQTGEKGTNVVLFPEASVISARAYAPDHLPRWPENDNPFEPAAKLACIAYSVRYHKVTAIKTQATEYEHISELFMSDLTRQRLRLA